jgi:ribosomal protein S18 acetylase RimI-like enzyme
VNGVILNDEERGISAGGIELLDAIRPLWEELNLHHAEKSRYFSDDYRAFTFDDRKEDLLQKARKGKFRISVYKQEGLIRGYSIASIKGAEGEVDSIYVRKAARGARIGEALMKDCLRWLKENGSKKIRVVVAYGNEEAFGFYAKYQLFPRATTLTTLNWHTGGKQRGDF